MLFAMISAGFEDAERPPHPPFGHLLPDGEKERYIPESIRRYPYFALSAG